jgi:hypothetical protein
MFLKFFYLIFTILNARTQNLPFNYKVYKKMQEASLRKKCMLFKESCYEEITRYGNFVCCGFMILDTRFSCYDLVPNRWGTSLLRFQTHLTPSTSTPNTWEPIPHNISTFQTKECACADCVDRLCTTFEIC